MQIVQLVQGSPEWQAHRAKCFNASDVPAMLDISPYKSRSQLLKEMATGVSQEVDAQTQRRFDDGHRFEALARPIAEQILDDDLYPIIATEDKYGLSRPLSASSDGLNMAVTKNFEHKSLNADLRRVFENNEPLPELYTSQMEAQHMVFGEVETLFMASKFDENDRLLEKRERAYKSDPDMRDRILAGWSQFQKDLDAYIPSEVKEMPKAEVSIELPALFINAHGAITSSNMEDYGIALKNKLVEVRAIKLVTDQDFSNAKEAAKMFREQCQKLKLAKEAMLAQTVTIGEAARMMDAWGEDLRVTALQLEKDVEKEDLAKKRAMVGAGQAAYQAHCMQLDDVLKGSGLRFIAENVDFSAAIKNKRNYASMQDAIDSALANGKIAADAKAKDLRDKIKWFKENGGSQHQFLFADLQAVASKPVDDFRLAVTSRIEAHKKAEAEKLEAETARIRAEEETKARLKIETEYSERLTSSEVRKEEVTQLTHSGKPSATWPFPIPSKKIERPSDAEIIRAIIKEFHCSNDDACDWILEIAESMKEAA